MKRFRTIAVLAMAVFMIAGSMSVFAATPYGHRISVSAGNGSFASDPGTGTTASVKPADSTVTVGGKTAKITPPANHVMIGYKIAGHDNSEIVTSIDVNSPTSYVHGKDVELVVAYGLESDIVKYQVRYVNEAGTDILPIETHYGANGTRQVVSFKHVEGYLPDAYNRIGTLQKGTTTLTVALDGESQANIYQATNGTLDIQYAVEETAKEGETIYKTKSVDTGDTTSLVMPIAVFAAAVVLLVLAVLSYRKDRKDGEEA